jgi:hypothetical protein
MLFFLKFCYTFEKFCYTFEKFCYTFEKFWYEGDFGTCFAQDSQSFQNSKKERVLNKTRWCGEFGPGRKHPTILYSGDDPSEHERT